MKYRKKPVIVDAWPIRDIIEGILFKKTEMDPAIRQAYVQGRLYVFPNRIRIMTLEGSMEADINDFLIKGVKGELYSCKPDIFHMTYDKVD